MNYIIHMSYTNYLIRISHTDYLIHITHMNYVIHMYYTESNKHKATINAINEEYESLPWWHKWHDGDGDVLKADNGSSQQRWRAQTKEKESRKRRKKMRRREIPYVRTNYNFFFIIFLKNAFHAGFKPVTFRLLTRYSNKLS